MKVQHTSYTIHQLMASKSTSVYVLNVSDNIQRIDDAPVKGDISIPIKAQSGESIILRVPCTWIPIDLSIYADKTDIQRAPRFRSQIALGNIELISEEDALKILETKDAQKELRRVAKVYNANMTTEVMTGLKQSEGEMESTGLKPAEGQIEKLKVNASVIEILARDDLSEDEKYSMVLNISDTLKQGDWQYIMDNSKESSINELALKHLVDNK